MNKENVNKEAKQSIRSRVLNLLRTQKEEERQGKSREIQGKLFSTKEFQEAKIILFYASFDGEVETFPMMEQAKRLGKKIALPKIIENKKRIVPTLIDNLEKDLEIGPYDIKQPKDECREILSLEEIDLVLVPGVAFDGNHNRLGRGAGYYDRFLKEIPSTIPTIGLAFDFQIENSLPCQEGFDIPVKDVITN